MGGAGRQVVDGDQGIDPNPQQAEALERWGLGYWEAVHGSTRAAPT